MNTRVRPDSEVKGDRLLEILLLGQDWLSNNAKFLVGIVIVALVGVWFYQGHLDSSEKEQGVLVSKAYGLSNISQKASFLDKHPSSKASVLLYLNLAREELEEGKFSEAKKHASQFIQLNPEHSHLGLAHLLKAYACEELKEYESARSSYKSAEKLGMVWKQMATEGLKRLP